ncbi:MAG: DUF1080 domain-containing protein [Bacteroidota bacterium]|nr:DUF1080 domain-containing protein [Bacteroidota bacterium]
MLLKSLPIILFSGLFCFTAFAKTTPEKSPPDTSLEGRWDITINMDGKSAPSWLEVTHSGLKTLVGHFVGTGGSARPISKVSFAGGKFSFSIPPQWEPEDHDLVVEGTLDNNGISGNMTFPNGKTYTYTGKRAPSLRGDENVSWGKPIKLFDGKNLNEWHTEGKNQWMVEDGMMRSKQSGSNLITNKKFTDFKLHIEFRYPAESNSGVYLRGRYEVQVMDSKGYEPSKVFFGGVYGFIAPTHMVAKAAGEWQSYDITLVGRMVTIRANGELIICRQEIPGITGGALDSDEGAPGPIYLQGDHGAIDYRNIVITPAK